VDVSGSASQQGGFLIVRLVNGPADLASATAFFNGAPYTMLASGDVWYAYIGLGQYLPVGEYALEVTSAAGTIASGSVTIGEGGFQYIDITLPPSSIDLLSDQAAIDAERATLNATYAVFTPQKLWSGPWIVPAQGSISNAYGLQRSINGGPYGGHSGTDIANETGTPLYASASGIVALAQEMYLYGNVLVIGHGAGVFSSYNHLSSIGVTAGQSVARGDYIGAMGETGFVSGPHVHWEAIVHGLRVDPVLFTQPGIDP
jgi:murein DD-endopeptidase MepM/ murein hydrolase activator NlpD